MSNHRIDFVRVVLEKVVCGSITGGVMNHMKRNESVFQHVGRYVFSTRYVQSPVVWMIVQSLVRRVVVCLLQSVLVVDVEFKLFKISIVANAREALSSVLLQFFGVFLDESFLLFLMCFSVCLAVDFFEGVARLNPSFYIKFLKAFLTRLYVKTYKIIF